MGQRERERPTTVLVVGATGATGRLLVKQLLDRGCRVKAVVRSPDKLPAPLRDHHRLELVWASILEVGDRELMEQVSGCDAIGSCLGHTLSFKGVFGPPRMLVRDAMRRLCAAILASRPAQPVRVVLMSSAGVRNRDLTEPVSLAQKWVIGLLRLLVPPHLDNERAADCLRTEFSREPGRLAWVAVRPDSLTDADEVTDYAVFPSPTRSAIFNAGKTSRINVAHLMADLMVDDAVWHRWQGQMPVIYNQESS